MTAWTSPKEWGTATVTVADMNTYLSDNTNHLYENLKSGEGWMTAEETWTYQSATSFTISGDYTTRYTRGVKLQLDNGISGKYYYVLYSTGLADVTTVHVVGESELVLVDQAITNTKYSRSTSPYLFPNTFHYKPAITGFSGTIQADGRFSLHENECSIYVYIEGTSNAGSMLFSAPIACATVPTTGTVGGSGPFAQYSTYNPALIKNNGTISIGIMNSMVTNNGSIQVRLGDTLTGFATAGTKGVYGELTYLIDDKWLG